MYPLPAGAPQPAPGLDSEDEIVRWNPDGRSVLVSHGRNLPVRLERVDVATGFRELVKVISPPDAAGVMSLSTVKIADDVNVYAYQATLQLSHLFLVQGAR